MADIKNQYNPDGISVTFRDRNGNLKFDVSLPPLSTASESPGARYNHDLKVCVLHSPKAIEELRQDLLASGGIQDLFHAPTNEGEPLTIETVKRTVAALEHATGQTATSQRPLTPCVTPDVGARLTQELAEHRDNCPIIIKTSSPGGEMRRMKDMTRDGGYHNHGPRAAGWGCVPGMDMCYRAGRPGVVVSAEELNARGFGMENVKPRRGLKRRGGRLLSMREREKR